MRNLASSCFVILLLISCTAKQKGNQAEAEAPPVSGLSGKELAAAHCGRCHAFVEPEVLPKADWQDVLPAMAHRMGIYKSSFEYDSLFDKGASGEMMRAAAVYPDKPLLAKEDWHKIEQYFLDNAPDSVPPPIREKSIRSGLKHFKYRETRFSHKPALTTMVKILPGKNGIVFADGKGRPNYLTFLTPELTEKYSLRLQSAPVHFYETTEGLYLTTVGKNIFPTDAADGALVKFTKTDSQPEYKPQRILISKLRRPVFMAYGDLNKDGLEDVVACEFGNFTGQLNWYENNGNGVYKKKLLQNKPGAVSAIIKDANNDGLPDIYVLMAQGDEGVFLYENKGAGKFEEKRLLTFSPLNGSQYIELADFNKDGFDDLVYVCGDNADKTPVLKKYHGIYIFLNDGKSNFRQSYFYQMNGAYKAMVRDYDKDGDLDIAAISFFPDYIRYPEESFIYLENKGGLKFDDYSFPEAPKGRWIVMDAGDMDEDGDTDIVLGSFVYFIPAGDTTGLGKKWLTTGPSIIVLENTIR